MKNYQFNRNLFLILVSVVAIFSLGVVYWYQNGAVSCLCTLPVNHAGENIAFNSYHLNSPTNVTLLVTNVGNLTVALAEYYVKDSSGDQYANFTWSGPAMPPGSNASVNLLLDGQLTGQPFQFQTGHTYTIVVVTARNTAFPYTFTP